MAADEPASPGSLETTEDVFLGDRLVIRQPANGYRAGIDAVLLAASVAKGAAKEARVLDVGAGVGTVGLCIAARLPQVSVVLYERAAELVHLAGHNITANGLSARVTAVAGDVAISAHDLAGLGLAAESFDHCVANPPFHDTAAGTPAGNVLKAGSHAMESGSLEHWVRFMARMTKPGGSAAMIHKAEALARVLAAFQRRFGAIGVLPISARAGEPAIRVLVEGVKGSRAPLTLKPGLVLHGPDQDFMPMVEKILRNGAALAH